MSMRARLPERAVVEQFLELARAPWDAEVFKRLGWRWSGDDAAVYVVDRWTEVRPSDPDLPLDGPFILDFAVFMDPEEDEDGDEVAEDWDGPKWTLRREAGRDEFDAVCEQAVELVTGLLGPPTAAGRDDDEQRWLHALWKLDGGRTVVVVQRDDIAFELGSLWIAETPDDDPPPGGPFVDWLYR